METRWRFTSTHISLPVLRSRLIHSKRTGSPPAARCMCASARSGVKGAGPLAMTESPCLRSSPSVVELNSHARRLASRIAPVATSWTKIASFDESKIVR